MQPSIVHIYESMPSIEGLASIIHKGTGLSLTARMDRSPIQFTNAAKLLIMLSEIDGVEQKYQALDVLRNTPKKCMSCIHYTMVLVLDQECLVELITLTRLSVINTSVSGAGYVALATGTLDVWFDAIVSNLVAERSFDFRLLLDKMLLSFEKLGLGELWHKYKKKSIRDKTFLLEHEK